MDANEFAKSMQALSLRCIDEYTKGMQRYAALIDNVSRQDNNSSLNGSGLGSAEQQKRHNDFMLSETPSVLGRITDASIQYYTALNDLSIQTINRYFDQVVHVAPSKQKNKDETSKKSPTKLIFHGVSNDTSSNAFLVTNQRNVAIDLSFDCSDVSTEDGKSQFKPKAKFTPSSCRLEPHGEQVVQCSLPLSKSFKPGETYHGSIIVVGFPDMAMPFSVDVEPAPVRKVVKKKVVRKKKVLGKKKAKKKVAAKKK